MDTRSLSMKLRDRVQTNVDPVSLTKVMLQTFGSREEFTHFMLANYFAYSALERAFALQHDDSPMARLWQEAQDLHGAPRRILRDLRAVGVDAALAKPSRTAAAYVALVEQAPSAELLGHFYCRYVMELLDTHQRQSSSLRFVVGLPSSRPEFNQFPTNVESDQRGYAERLSKIVDDEGDLMGGWCCVRAERGVRAAWEFSMALHAERPMPLTRAFFGSARMAQGILAAKVFGSAKPLAGRMLLPTQKRSVGDA